MKFGEHLATISFYLEQFLLGEHARKMIGCPFYIYVNSEVCSLSNSNILFTHEKIGKE
jgi:hypothetical protein